MPTEKHREQSEVYPRNHSTGSTLDMERPPQCANTREPDPTKVPPNERQRGEMSSILNESTDNRINVGTVELLPDCECEWCSWTDNDPADCRCPACDPDWYRDQAQADALERR